jgi:hypothetical protein
MADFDLFDSIVTAESTDQVRRAAQERSLKEAAFNVRRQFGNYLANAESTMDYHERFAYLRENIQHVLAESIEPTEQVFSWLKEELFPESLKEKPISEKHGKLARRGDDRSAPWVPDSQELKRFANQAKDPRTVIGGIDWQWDNDSNSFKSTKTSNFQCVCGSAVSGVGQHECNCGRLWNLSSITDGNKTASPPTYVCREVMRRDVHLAKKADKIDPADPHKHTKDDEWEYSDGYDVKDFMGPAAGEEEHDAHLSALDMIFAAEEDQDAPDASAMDGASNDSAGDVSAGADEPSEFTAPPESQAAPVPAPMGAPGPIAPTPLGVENQPAEDADIQGAQQAILDMILREKAEEVTNDENNSDEIKNLNDAYQSLDVVQDLESAEMMGGLPQGMSPQLASYRAGAKYGYILGYLEALADNSYENRKTDYEGTEPPREGLSPGMDDADPTPGKDTTDELRNLLKNQFDEDNGGKDEKPLDPPDPFGPDKGKSSRFRVRN